MFWNVAVARQGAHSPQKSSGSLWQLAACENIRASVNFPRPRVPAKSMACGILPVASIPRRATTIRELPRNSENGMSGSFLKLCYCIDGAKDFAVFTKPTAEFTTGPRARAHENRWPRSRLDEFPQAAEVRRNGRRSSLL